MTQMMVKIGKKGEEKERKKYGNQSTQYVCFHLNWLHYISAVDYIAHSEN